MICSGCRRPQSLPYIWASQCLRLRFLLIQGQGEMKWSFPSQTCCRLNENTFYYNVSQVLGDVRTGSSHCFWKCDKNTKLSLSCSCLPENLSRLLFTCQWGEMAASHCRSWWRWGSNTLILVTTVVILVMFVLITNTMVSHLQSVTVWVSLNSISQIL